MGLSARKLELEDFRSFTRKSVCFADGVTVLVGKNAVGKTNTIEALQLLTSGVSFRHPSSSQLIREGAVSAKAKLTLEGDRRVVDVSCTIEQGKKSFEKNGKKCRSFDVPGTLTSVLFTPDDLAIVKRGASHRRDEIDYFARQVNAGYAKVLASYVKAVAQRNRLLKGQQVDKDLLGAWDEVIAKGGAALLHARMRLFKRLNEKVRDIYLMLSKGEELSCEYVCSLEGVDENCSKDDIKELFSSALMAYRDEDLRRQQTSVGPHRDDILFMIDGRDAKGFGSQGQQRSVALALKMAEVQVATELLGERPVLLLDDVMSELDESRREQVVAFALSGTQTVVTTTNLGYFTEELLGQAEVVAFDG